MKVTLMALTGLLAVAGFCSCDNNDDNNDMSQQLNSTDSSFVTMAGMSNTAEIQAARLADSLSTDSVILDFANKMIEDHSATQSSLKTLAGQYNLTVPDSVDAQHAAIMAQLATMTGRAFDSMYIHQQVVDHQAAIDLYNGETNNGNNGQLKNFATTTLPHLNMHKASADSIAALYP